MKSALEHMEAAIREVEERLSQGHITADEAREAISKIRNLHETLNRLEAKINAKPD